MRPKPPWRACRELTWKADLCAWTSASLAPITVTLQLVVAGEVEDVEALATVVVEVDSAVVEVAEAGLEIVAVAVVVDEGDEAALPTVVVSVISPAKRQPFKAIGVLTTAGRPYSRLAVVHSLANNSRSVAIPLAFPSI